MITILITGKLISAAEEEEAEAEGAVREFK